jgi:RNA polymerase sigma-70 factor (ECF subfamily)
MVADPTLPAIAELPEPPSSGEDRALVERLLRKDEAAFASLVQQLHPIMLRMAHAMLPSRAITEETVQETWQAVLQGLPRFEGRSSLRTWILRILIKRARTRGVREHRSIPVPTLAEGNEPLRGVDGGRLRLPVLASELTPERALLDGELRSRIEAAIATLAEAPRQVLTLRDIAGWTAAEVCNVLEISETNQRVILHRARMKVRAALTAYLEGVPEP